MKTNKKIAYLLLLQIILVKILGQFPNFIENWYSKGLYPKIAWFFRTLFGSIPFSVGDILYAVLLFLICKWVWKNSTEFLKNWKNIGLTLLSAISIFYFFFHFLWGMNYYRIPIDEKLNIQKEYSVTELVAFTEKMIAKTNALQLQITQHDSVKVTIPYTNKKMFELAQYGYQNLPNNLSLFKHQIKSTKASLFSYPLSYMGFGGYINPFTNEAQVNILKPKYTSPITICHEMAHQTGIGSESECNFIGFVTASKNEDLYFKYSAYSFITRYCLRNLEMIQEGKSEKFLKTINKGVLKNFKESELFWEQYHSPIDTLFEFFYDNFLKANQQQDGMESYSKFVGLVIGFEKVDSDQLKTGYS